MQARHDRGAVVEVEKSGLSLILGSKDVLFKRGYKTKRKFLLS